MRWPPLALVLCSTAAFADAPPASLDRPAVVAGMTAIRPQLKPAPPGITSPASPSSP